MPFGWMRPKLPMANTNNSFWVRDSIAREKLSAVDETYKITQDKKGNELAHPRLNWDKRIPLEQAIGRSKGSA